MPPLQADRQRLKHRNSQTENTVPLFWPFELAAAIAKGEMNLFSRGLSTFAEAEKLEFGLKPKFATANTVITELHTLRLRDFSTTTNRGECPTMIDAPYAGHSAVIADLHAGQSLVQTLLANGLTRVLVTDWKSATNEMSTTVVYCSNPELRCSTKCAKACGKSIPSNTRARARRTRADLQSTIENSQETDFPHQETARSK